MPFASRADAGRLLGERLARELPPAGEGGGSGVVVLALTRGGVPVGAEVARALGAPLDVVVVRKLGVPWQPELAMGAIAEGTSPGQLVRLLNDDVIHRGDVRPEQLSEVEERERAELDRRARRYRGGRPPVAVDGATVVVVDDGIATGATARVACRSARARGAARVVLAVPVGPPGTEERMSGDADAVVCLETPSGFYAVGQCYDDFGQVGDDEVTRALAT